MGVLRQEEGRGLDLCVREGGKGRGREGNHLTLKICIQKGFEQSLTIHIPLIELFYPLLKNRIRT